MPLRTTMSEVIAALRQHGQAAYDDQFNGEVYWNDLQLQQIADQHSRVGKLRIKQANTALTVYRVIMPPTYILENSFLVYDEFGSAVLDGTPTYNADTQEITFSTPRTSDTYFIEARVINLFDALGDLWHQKAEQRFKYIDWKAQNNKMNMGQEYQHCLDRSLYYRSKTVRSFKRDGRGKWWA